MESGDTESVGTDPELHSAKAKSVPMNGRYRERGQARRFQTTDDSRHQSDIFGISLDSQTVRSVVRYKYDAREDLNQSRAGPASVDLRPPRRSLRRVQRIRGLEREGMTREGNVLQSQE